MWSGRQALESRLSGCNSWPPSTDLEPSASVSVFITSPSCHGEDNNVIVRTKWSEGGQVLRVSNYNHVSASRVFPCYSLGHYPCPSLCMGSLSLGMAGSFPVRSKAFPDQPMESSGCTT